MPSGTAILATAFLIVGYGCVDSPKAVQQADKPDSIILIDEPFPYSWPLDTVVILEAEIEQKDLLKLSVEYCAGSREHIFRLIALAGWQESYPPGKRIVLSHDGQDDSCEFYTTRILYFDLKPLKELKPASPWIWLSLRGFNPAVRYILNE